MYSNTIDEVPLDHQVPLNSMLAHGFEDTEPLITVSGESSIKIRAADSAGHRSSASILIDKMYAWRGYKSNSVPTDPDPNRLTLVASDQNRMVGTMTIGFDSETGLLVEDLFASEVTTLRDSGRRVCEFTKLAMDRVVGSQRILAAMFHVAFIHAHRLKGCDNLLIEVNPRHVRYYQAKLGFKTLGAERLNRRVEAPAVLLSLDLWDANKQIIRLGGRPELAATERSLFPYSFSAREEAAIIGRLRGALAS